MREQDKTYLKKFSTLWSTLVMIIVTLCIFLAGKGCDDIARLEAGQQELREVVVELKTTNTFIRDELRDIKVILKEEVR